MEKEIGKEIFLTSTPFDFFFIWGDARTTWQKVPNEHTIYLEHPSPIASSSSSSSLFGSSPTAAALRLRRFTYFAGEPPLP